MYLHKIEYNNKKFFEKKKIINTKAYAFMILNLYDFLINLKSYK